MKVLVSNIMMLKDQKRFSDVLGEKGIEAIFPKVDQFLTESDALNLVGDIDGWLAGDDQITKSVLLKATPKLKVISKWGTGTDSIDKVAANELGVPVLNSPGAFRDAVSEVAIAYILDLARSITSTDREVRLGGWPKKMDQGLVGKTIGVIGFGAIGKGIYERAIAFKTNVIVHDPYFVSDEEFPEVVNSSFENVITSADYLCIACSMNKENVHLINADALNKMKDTSCIINVARGPLIDESALVEALSNGGIGGAGLDVFEIEPLPKISKLLDFDNVILGSHNANHMAAATEYVHDNTLKNLFEVLGV